jgi:ubiquinone/menaquinone biosynthesis C-methylase UbiE
MAPSEYDDELWLMVPEDPGPPPKAEIKFVKKLGRVDGAALDLGCGDGRLTAELRARRIVGADVSDVALERARTRLAKLDVRLVPLTPDRRLPFRDNEFELVLCAETIEHVVDVQMLLSEIRRVLAPGGRVAISTPAHSRLTGLSMLLRGFERGFDPLSPHVRFFSSRSLRTLLDEMGFEIDSVRRRGGTLFVVASR